MEATDFKNVTVENITPGLFEVAELGYWNFIETKNEQNSKWKFIKTRWFWIIDHGDLKNGL